MKDSKKCVDIKNPCNVKWESLSGDGCERFCKICEHNVVDLTTKSNAEIIKLVMMKKGKLCGRISQSQVRRIILRNQTNKVFTKAFFVFLLGFASITPAKSAENFMTKTSFEFPKINLNKVIAKNELVNLKQDSLVKFYGTVTNESNEPIPMVNVNVKGSYLGAVTNELGKFELEIKKNTIADKKITLVFSSVGFLSTEIELTDKTKNELEVKLTTDITSIGEIIFPWYQRLWWWIKWPFVKKGY